MAEGLTRGDVVTIAGRGPYTGKPRPAVVVQSERFSDTDSLTVCPFSSVLVDTPLIRVRVAPDASNGLRHVSDVMVDKIVTVSQASIGGRIGRVRPSDLARVDRALLVFLGLAG